MLACKWMEFMEHILQSIWGKAPLVSPKGCVCELSNTSLPALHVQQARESSCLLPVRWLLPFTLFNMCNSHFLWLVSKRPRGKTHSVADCQSPPLEKTPLPFPPHTPVRSQNKHDSKWLAGYVIMIIALFFWALLIIWLHDGYCYGFHTSLKVTFTKRLRPWQAKWLYFATGRETKGHNGHHTMNTYAIYTARQPVRQSCQNIPLTDTKYRCKLCICIWYTQRGLLTVSSKG